jgi:hypothetical protein
MTQELLYIFFQETLIEFNVVFFISQWIQCAADHVAGLSAFVCQQRERCVNKRRFNVDQSRKFKFKPEPGLWSMNEGQGLSASQAREMIRMARVVEI